MRTPDGKVGEGLVGLTGWHRPEVIKQLKILAAREGAKQQHLMAEALNLLFRRYQLPAKLTKWEAGHQPRDAHALAPLATWRSWGQSTWRREIRPKMYRSGEATKLCAVEQSGSSAQKSALYSYHLGRSFLKGATRNPGVGLALRGELSGSAGKPAKDALVPGLPQRPVDNYVPDNG